jgi:hypothetical protein
MIASARFCQFSERLTTAQVYNSAGEKTRHYRFTCLLVQDDRAQFHCCSSKGFPIIGTNPLTLEANE